MIRQFSRDDLPMLACVAQEGDQIAIAYNPHYALALPLPQRMGLFNRLMVELEIHGGGVLHFAGGEDSGAIVINLTDLRERKEIAARLASVIGVNN